MQISKNNYFIIYIYFYTFVMPWNFFNGQMGTLSIILLFWWGFIAKEQKYLTKLKLIFKFKPLFVLILFFVYSYLSLLWTDNFSDAKKALTYYKYYWIMIPILFTALSKDQAKKAIYIFIISLGIYALFSLSIYLNIVNVIDHSLNPTNTSNPRGILAYAIITPYMAIGFLSSLFIVAYNDSKKIKFLFIFIAILCFIGIFMNNGRAGQVAFFITLLVLIIANYKKFFNYKSILGLASILVISYFLLQDFHKLNRFEHGFNELKNLERTHFAGSWGARAYMWYAAVNILQKDPILGTGVGDNIDEFIKYTKTHPSKSTWLRSFHNQHLDTLTRYGLVGYFLLWGSVILLLYKLRADSLYFALGVVFFSITYFDGLGDIILLMKPYNYVFMMIFLMLSIISAQRSKV